VEGISRSISPTWYSVITLEYVSVARMSTFSVILRDTLYIVLYGTSIVEVYNTRRLICFSRITPLTPNVSLNMTLGHHNLSSGAGEGHYRPYRYIPLPLVKKRQLNDFEIKINERRIPLLRYCFQTLSRFKLNWSVASCYRR
jgi:hypothetical protein